MIFIRTTPNKQRPTTVEKARRLLLQPDVRPDKMIKKRTSATAAKYRSGELPPLREGGAYELRRIRDKK